MENENVKRCVGYLRVSTDEQKEGVSLDNQEARLRAYAASQDLEISEVYRDEGFSAKDIRRPDLERLLNDARAGKIDLILVYRLDRLTRSMKDLYSLLDLFKKNNVAFKSISEDFCTNTPVGKVVLGILGLFAEWERDVIGARIKDALGHKKLMKEWVGRPPLGYRTVKRSDGKGGIIKEKHLRINQDEAKIVKMIFQARSRGRGLTEIVRTLKSKGLNGKWSPIGVWKILNNKTYLGNGTHEAIISKRLFDQAQGGEEK